MVDGVLACAKCGTKLRRTVGEKGKLATLDHIVRLSHGGSNFDDNLQLLCPQCHRVKDRIGC